MKTQNKTKSTKDKLGIVKKLTELKIIKYVKNKNQIITGNKNYNIIIVGKQIKRVKG